MQTDVRGSVMEALNRGTMGSDEAIGTYEHYTEITPPERSAFASVRAEVSGQPILDLGVGAGRTVTALLELSHDYVGLDYTRRMVETCQRRFPARHFLHGDARDLSRFSHGTFKLVVFSCNGLCMVTHRDRLTILAEVHRVLRSDGIFIFSTHNQASPDHTAGFVFPELEISLNPLRLGMRLMRFGVATGRRMRNHRRLRRHDMRGPDYSIINDRCHDYATMLYYITAAEQRRQLAGAGFTSEPMAYDLSGGPLAVGATDPSILFVARK